MDVDKEERRQLSVRVSIYIHRYENVSNPSQESVFMTHHRFLPVLANGMLLDYASPTHSLSCTPLPLANVQFMQRTVLRVMRRALILTVRTDSKEVPHRACRNLASHSFSFSYQRDRESWPSNSRHGGGQKINKLQVFFSHSSAYLQLPCSFLKIDESHPPSRFLIKLDLALFEKTLARYFLLKTRRSMHLRLSKEAQGPVHRAQYYNHHLVDEHTIPHDSTKLLCLRTQTLSQQIRRSMSS